MPCHYCIHWRRDDAPYVIDKMIENVISTETGQCTFYPTWQETTGLHYCAQLKTDPKLLGEFWVRMHQNAREVRKEIGLRKAAEKKLKELRKKRAT